MKMRLTVVSLMALVAACGGPVRQVEESTAVGVTMTLAEKGAIDQATVGGGVCGGRVCSTGTYCCNASCGMCAPKGAACPQVSCN